MSVGGVLFLSYLIISYIAGALIDVYKRQGYTFYESDV